MKKWCCVLLCLVLCIASALTGCAKPQQDMPADVPQVTPETAPDIDPTPTPEAAVEEVPAPQVTPEAAPEPTPTPAESVDTQMDWPETMPQVVKQHTFYELQIEVLEQTHQLQCRMKVDYQNQMPQALDEVYLHLYPNAFQTLPHGVWEQDTSVYPNGFDPASLTVETVALNGTKADYRLENEAQLLCVPLESPLLEGERCELYLTFTIQVPQMNNRFGWNEDGMYLGNCFPVAAARNEDGSWKLDPYIHIGDPFCSDVADYRAAITCDESWALACTGLVVEEAAEDGRMTRYVAGFSSREFACALLADMECITVKTGETQVVSYAKNRHLAQTAAEDAAAALGLFSQRIGAYPYASLTVVECAMGGGLGMEYAGLVFIGKTFYDRSQPQEMAITIAHEVAHQWFYGVVGSDGANEPWVDEALVQFLGVWFLKYTYDESLFETRLHERSSIRAAPGEDLDQSVYDIGNADTYGQLVYVRGSYLFRMLYEGLGEDLFFQALGEYYAKHAFSIATGEDLWEAFAVYFRPYTAKSLHDSVFAGLQ